MPSRVNERGASNERGPKRRSTSRSPKPRSASASKGRSLTPPPGNRRSMTPPPGSRQSPQPRMGSSSPIQRRRALKKGASVRNPENPQKTGRRMPKNNSFSGIEPNRKHKNMAPLSINTDNTADSNSTRSNRQLKRKGSSTEHRNSDIKLTSAADRVASEPIGRYNNRQGTHGGNGNAVGQPKRMMSLGNVAQQSRTSAPERMNSLGNPSQQLRTQPPTRMNSLSSRLSTPTQPNRPVKKEKELSPLHAKKRAVDLKNNDAIIPKGSIGHHSSNRNSSSHIRNNSRHSNRLRRWGFGGETSEEDAEYGESGSIGSYDSFGGKKELAAPNGKKNKVVDCDSDSEWDSEADEAYMMRNGKGGGGNGGDTGTLPPPVGKRKESRNLSQALFPDDKWWHTVLRYFRILPPVPNEGRTRRSVRKLIWATLLFDALVAIVTIATYSGTVTMCCNQVTMASIPTIDWNTFIKVVSYIYLVGIFLEILPVVREGPIPWNLLNPIFGSLLSFAVFVDDSKAEAIGIWILEISSVILEGVTYLRLKKLYQREERRLEKLDGFLKGDQDALYRKGGQYKKNAYLRERRLLRIEHAQNKKKLRYHFVGVSVNFVLVCLTLLLMILVARGGGMCLVAEEGLDLFHPDQRSRCFECLEQSDGWESTCQVCKEGPNEDPMMNDPIQCFYPYF